VPPAALPGAGGCKWPGEGQRDSQGSLPKIELNTYLDDNATEL
jgi:hypothetical protein